LELPAELVKRNLPVTWLAGITIVLGIFLVFLPYDIRMLFWYRLQAQSILVSMMLIFSLVAISLVWSGGQTPGFFCQLICAGRVQNGWTALCWVLPRPVTALPAWFWP
jgi:hypothetical protein